MSSVVTIRLDKRTKEKVKLHGINLSETLRTALNKEIQRREEEETCQVRDEDGSQRHGCKEDYETPHPTA